MKKLTRITSMAAGAVIAAGGISAGAIAADYPHKTVTIVLSHSLGGGQDRATRAFAKVWSKHLGSKLNVKPKNGASGRVGFDYWVKQPRDGSNLLSSNVGTTSIMYVRQRPNWSWTEKVHFLGLMGVDPGAIFVTAKSPFKSINDVIAAAKKETVIAGLSSWDSPENMVLSSLPKQTGIKPMRVIPIGGGSDVVTAVLGGHLPVGFGKVSSISRAGDKIRFLAVAMDKNDAPQITGNAPVLDKALGIKTIQVASYRAMIIPAEMANADKAGTKMLLDSFLAAKADPAYTKAAKKVGLPKDLLGDWTHTQLQDVAEKYWASYQDNANLFKVKVKDLKAKIKIAKIKDKGKYIYFTDKDGKQWKTRLHNRSTKFWLDGERVKGKKANKKAFAKLKVGNTCDITYSGLPLRAKTAKCMTK